MSILSILAAFFGGIIGASLGGVNVFIITGLFAIVGVATDAAGVSFSLLNNIAFGAFLGPHITFAGAAVAVSYAKKMGWVGSGKDMGVPLAGTGHPSIMAVGGIVGIAGFMINYSISNLFPNRVDTPAATIFILTILGKIIFDTPNIFGTVPEEIKKIGGRYSISTSRAWISSVQTAPQKVIIGLGAGGSAAYLTLLMYSNPVLRADAPALVFGIGALMTIFLIAGQNVPVLPHIMINGAYGVIGSGGNIWWGIAFGIIGAFLGDFMSKTFYVYGDAHVDPPAMAITTGSLISLTLLPATGLAKVGGNVLPQIVIGLFIIWSIIQHVRLTNIIMKKELESAEMGITV